MYINILIGEGGKRDIELIIKTNPKIVKLH